MVDKTQNWSREWKSSEQPSKQRKYRENAPQHIKDKMISANLGETLREELGTRNLQINLGDRVEVMRGDFTGSSGIVSNIDRQEEKVYINGLEIEKQDGTQREVAFRPSNLRIKAINLENMERIEKYEVDDADKIRVDEEEVEEVLEEDEEGEMMKQMQGGGEAAETEEIDTEEVEEEAEDDEEDEEDTETEETDSEDEGTVEKMEEQVAEDIVSGTISDAKEAIKELENPDYEELIEAEKANKDRKTMIEYLEGKQED